ncbi:hypothetical protein [Nocardia sp. AG03]|uniref:hypothetical protein n=1 Tax=Nocardia sp. AG03 TaxID=3025312 RepID=UPI0024185A8B|nr:hypothetical protein [Nocardia sp. AG03]
MTTQHARGARRRTVLATTILGLLCGLAAWLLFEWWASDIDGFVVYDASYEPLPEPPLETPVEGGGSGVADLPLRVGLVVVPAAIGLVAGCVAAACGVRVSRSATTG